MASASAPSSSTPSTAPLTTLPPPPSTTTTSKDHDEEESMWENEYAFSSFKLKVMEEFGGDACVGGTQWPGGVRVARYLDNPLVFPPEAQTWKAKTLLDLGSGCGLVAAVAAKLGAKVLAVDKDIVMDILKENLEANGVLAEVGALSADAAAALAGGGKQ